MMTYGWIALLTDYGRRDGFVAACHGVVARVAPQARVIDVTHDVPARDIRHGAVVLAQTAPYLPPAVVVGIVDPGVGSDRRGIAVVAGEYVFIGPDNGLLPWAADAVGGMTEAVELTAAQYRLGGTAMTFHGRDVFAPAAAHVAAGVPVRELGPPVDDVIRLPEPVVLARRGELETEAHLIDHFGNVALAARAADLAAAGISMGDPVRVDVGAYGVARTVEVVVGGVFADVARGELLLYVDAYGHVALALNQDDAAVRLGIKSGDPVTVRRSVPGKVGS